MSLASCKPDPVDPAGDNDSYKQFIGTWGVERIEYYYIDYAGNPIPATIETHEFTPGDPNDGIDLVFKADKTGEMRRRDIDTFYVQISVEPELYDTIINPDSTAVTAFFFSYDEDVSVLPMKLRDDMTTYWLQISNFTDQSFTYVNQYKVNYVEKAVLKRLSNDARAEKVDNKPSYRPRRPGSLLSY